MVHSLSKALVQPHATLLKLSSFVGLSSVPLQQFLPITRGFAVIPKQGTSSEITTCTYQL